MEAYTNLINDNGLHTTVQQQRVSHLSRRKRIYFDQTQNERGRLEGTYSALRRLLKDNGFDVEPYTEFAILEKSLEGADVMVFGCPNSSKLRAQEIEALLKYVEKGGGLMLLSLSGGDRGLMNNMSEVSKNFGIGFENTAVRDERSESGLPTMPVIEDLKEHYVTRDVHGILYPSGCTLEVKESAQAVAFTSTMAEPPSRPVVAVAEYGKGRIVCVGSYEVFRKGGGLAHRGNKVFAVNAFKWLCREDATEEAAAAASTTMAPSATTPTAAGTTGTRTKTGAAAAGPTKEMEQALRRLVSTVFDLREDIGKLSARIEDIEGSIAALRDQFQEFAEKTQTQLGMLVPAKQFRTEEESRREEIEADIKALQSEIASIERLKEHIDKRHSSGVMSKEVYEEQAKRLEERIENLKERLQKKEEELAGLTP